MTDDLNSSEHEHKKKNKVKCNGISGGIYGMAFLGALVYYLQHATSFGTVVWGILKAIFWPAVIIYKVLEILKL